MKVETRTTLLGVWRVPAAPTTPVFTYTVGSASLSPGGHVVAPMWTDCVIGVGGRIRLPAAERVAAAA